MENKIKVTIEILYGNNHDEPTKRGMDSQIALMDKYANEAMGPVETMLAMDIKSILEGIRKQLPETN